MILGSQKASSDFIPRVVHVPMAIPIEKIAVGKCFVTSASQVRRVSKIADGMVFYTTRNLSGHWNEIAHSVFCVGFAEQVEREVLCSWDADSQPANE